MLIERTGRPEGCKLIRVSADTEDRRITAISIRGDFFASPEEGFERAEKRLVGVEIDEAGKRFDEFLAEEGVQCAGICGEGLARLLQMPGEAE